MKVTIEFDDMITWVFDTNNMPQCFERGLFENDINRIINEAQFTITNNLTFIERGEQ